jgi:formylglycine-generating enzyme required for sulfatase activity
MTTFFQASAYGRVKQIIKSFADARRAGLRPSIEEYLAQAPRDRSLLLNELVSLDLEQRIAAGEVAQVEEYLSTFPELQAHEDLLIALVKAEYRHRARFGQNPTPSEYYHRFPQHRERLLRITFDRVPSQKVEPSDASSSELPPISAIDDLDLRTELFADRNLSADLPATVGRFQLDSFVDRGGMGDVFRLQDGDFHRTMAMKVLQERFAGSEESTKRFLHEAEITGHLQHPGIPPVQEKGFLPDGRPYFIMKFVDGSTLDKLLRARSSSSDRLPYFLGVFEQICQTVAYAHTLGIIHRDLKPSNVMVGTFGEVQVMDWGLAKVLAQPAATVGSQESVTTDSFQDRRLGHFFGGTVAGGKIGTAPYMPPEQARGQLDQMDRRSDVFGLGAILCFILTGKPAFLGHDAAEMAKRGDISETYVRLDASGADSELICLAKHCLAAEPSQRPQDANAVAAEIGQYQELVRERLRLAEIEKGQAEVRVAEERKRFAVERQKRQRTVALAAAVLLLVVGAGGGIWWAFEQQAEQERRIDAKRKETHAEDLVQSILSAEPSELPGLLSQLSEHRPGVDRLLRNEFENPGHDPRRKLGLSLALLPVDETQFDYAYTRLLGASPQELSVIRDQLAPHKATLRDRLWPLILSAENTSKSQQFRAAAALAKYDPNNPDWEKVKESVAVHLVQEPTFFVPWWLDAFRPVRSHLLPQVALLIRDPARSDRERSMAVEILADYAADDPVLLANALMDADDKQFLILFPQLAKHEDLGARQLFGELQKSVPSELPASNPQREALAKRQANAAVALLRFNKADKVWPLLRHSADPRLRSYIIHRAGPLGVEAATFTKRLDPREELDVTIRRALILSMGGCDPKRLHADVHKSLIADLMDMYRADPDPGIHAATEWLLRNWGHDDWLKKVNSDWARDVGKRALQLEELRKELAGRVAVVANTAPAAPPRWFVNSQGQTMVVIPGPVKFTMGAPLTEKERRDQENPRPMTIARTFAIASKPITVGQLLVMNPYHYRYGEAARKQYNPDDTCPVTAMSWHDAARYCNWLSKREGLDECYEFKDDNVIRMKANYLALGGYRLPREAEMEYIMRAEASTSRFYGETAELLPKYAWFLENSKQRTWPVGLLMPNDFGFFDVMGNAWTWCQDRFSGKGGGIGPDLTEDTDTEVDFVGPGRMLRGSAFGGFTPSMRSATRHGGTATNRTADSGFRIARTIVP